ncbi:MAG: hypothetical protein KBB57_12435 [Amaricoccus sp.]|nr:hypothetical protein [Amaricoccus sp.]
MAGFFDGPPGVPRAVVTIRSLADDIVQVRVDPEAIEILDLDVAPIAWFAGPGALVAAQEFADELNEQWLRSVRDAHLGG